MKSRYFTGCLPSAVVLPMVWCMVAWMGAAPARACDTPVYRYAMYRWMPAPYEIYYFHTGSVSEEYGKLRQAIDKLLESEKEQANVALFPVDLSKDPELKRVPPYVKFRWEAKKNRRSPGYLILSPRPYWAEVYYGDLDAKSLPALVDSPARAKMNKMLAQGKCGVLVLMENEKQEENQKAEKASQQLVKAVADGKLDLYMGPGVPPWLPPEEKKAAQQRQKNLKPEIGLVKVSRSDAKEKWLVRSLLAVEPDLHELDHPMVFVVYGRGRALPPYVGKGITVDNMAECIYAVTDACSCMVKDQNPGVDLPTHFDWESAAAAMAEKFGGEGGGGRIGDLFPMFYGPPPGENPKSDGEKKPNEKKPSEAKPDDGKDPQTKDAGAGGKAAGTASDDRQSAVLPPSALLCTLAMAGAADGAPPPKKTLEKTPAQDKGDSDTAAGPKTRLIIGAGLVVGFVALVGVTFLLLKPR